MYEVNGISYYVENIKNQKSLFLVLKSFFKNIVVQK